MFVLAGWTANTTAAGETYYEDHTTKITQWERPVHRHGPGSAALVNWPVDSGVSAAEAPLPPGMYTHVVAFCGGVRFWCCFWW